MNLPETSFRPTDHVLADVRADAAHRIHVRARRRRRTARGAGGGVVVLALVVGAVAFDATRDDADGRTVADSTPATVTTSTSAPPVPGPVPGESLPMAASGLSGRSAAITAWTGRELLVWRGHGELDDGDCETTDDGAPLCGEPIRTDGARYDPSSDTWRPMAESPMPPDPGSTMASTVGVWTGEELVVWGGPGPDAAAYDPDTDAWRSFDPGPLSARMGASAVWTGEEVVILGGAPRGEDIPDGGSFGWEIAALDPSTGEWRTPPKRPTGPALDAFGHRSVWTGTDLLRITNSAVGVNADDSPLAAPARMHVVDLGRGSRERRLADPPLHVVDQVVPVDGRIVAIGMEPWGQGLDNEASTDFISVSTYDPAANEWSEPVEVPGAVNDSGAVWTGSEVVFIVADGAEAGSSEEAPIDVRTFDPAAGVVRAVEIEGLSARGRASAAWTGTELLLWGGERRTERGLDQLDDGVRFRPT